MTHHESCCERRRASRYRVSLPIEIDGRSSETLDVNRFGVRFTTEASVTPGTRIEFRLSVPLEMQVFRIECEGRVVRVAGGKNETQVVATIDSMRMDFLG